MNKKIHVYRQRHIFRGDEMIGRYEVRTRRVTLEPGMAEHWNEVRAHFIRAHGFLVRLDAEGAKTVVEKPLSVFPPEVLAATDPMLGDLTPTLVKYARENFPEEEFRLRYAGRVAEVLPAEAVSPALPVVPKKGAAKRRGGAARKAVG